MRPLFGSRQSGGGGRSGIFLVVGVIVALVIFASLSIDQSLSASKYPVVVHGKAREDSPGKSIQSHVFILWEAHAISLVRDLKSSLLPSMQMAAIHMHPHASMIHGPH